MTKSIVRVYTTENCPMCGALKVFLSSNGFTYEEVNMSTAEALTELRMNGVFTTAAPVLQSDNTFLTLKELFDEGRVKESILEVMREGDE